MRGKGFFNGLLAGASFAPGQSGSGGHSERLPLAPSAPGLSVIHYIEDNATVSFEGRRYGFEEGTPVLLEILAAGDRVERTRREQAAMAMSRMSRHPVVATRLPELLRAAEREATADGRALFDRILMEVDDPGLLGYFEDVLRSETEPVRRFTAAYALARWNVVTGARELVDLVRCDYRRDAWYLARDVVAPSLSNLSEQNGWGMPVPECPSLPKGVKPSESAEYAKVQSELRAWLDANADRFPEVPAALRDQWRVYLQSPAEDHRQEREELKQRVRALIERLVSGLPATEAARRSARDGPRSWSGPGPCPLTIWHRRWSSRPARSGTSRAWKSSVHQKR